MSTEERTKIEKAVLKLQCKWIKRQAFLDDLAGTREDQTAIGLRIAARAIFTCDKELSEILESIETKETE